MNLHTILVNYVVPLLVYGAITGIANLLLSHKSQIEAYAESYPRWAGFLKLLRAVGFDPWNAIAGISLWAKGKLPAAQQNGAKAVAAMRSVGAAYVESEDDRPTPPSLPPAAAALLLVGFLSMHQTACVNGSPSPKTIADVAKELCLVAFGEQHAALNPVQIAQQFCATEAQLDPFIQQLLAAKRAAMAQQTAVDDAKKTPVLTGCAAALENGKKLGCGFEADDAGGWCSALSAAQVTCLTGAKACLAFRQCTEVSK